LVRQDPIEIPARAKTTEMLIFFLCVQMRPRSWKAEARPAASRQRPGFLSLLNDASQRVFDVAVCEVIDHLGRRLADTADLHDQVNFRSIGLHAASMGEITAIHLGVMGTMGRRLH
jgi:hypothetical protein